MPQHSKRINNGFNCRRPGPRYSCSYSSAPGSMHHHLSPQDIKFPFPSGIAWTLESAEKKLYGVSEKHWRMTKWRDETSRWLLNHVCFLVRNVRCFPRFKKAGRSITGDTKGGNAFLQSPPHSPSPAPPPCSPSVTLLPCPTYMTGANLWEG